jgi:hypothetical protein
VLAPLFDLVRERGAEEGVLAAGVVACFVNHTQLFIRIQLVLIYF